MSTDAPLAPAAAPPPPTGAAEPEGSFSLALRLREDYVQVVDFHLADAPPLLVDELAPLGGGEGPNPSRLLGAAVGSCLGASLLFCLRRARIDVLDLHTTVEGTLVRNAKGRLRIGAMHVRVQPDVAEADRERMTRCLGLFEDFCIVTESVRHGIDVTVQVDPTSSPAA